MGDEHDRRLPGCLGITAYETPEAHVLVLEGEFDISTVDSLGAAVAMAMSRHPLALVIDLRKLRFFGSAGLTSLIDADRRCRDVGCRLVLVRGSRLIQRIFVICGVERLFEFVDRPDEAAPSLRPSYARRFHLSAPHGAFN